MELTTPSDKTFQLPVPSFESNVSVEQALLNRRSRRDFKSDPISMNDVSQILWAAYGINQSKKFSLFRSGRRLKTAPSAGARYPLELYLVAGKVNDLPPGLFKYLPSDHCIRQISDKDLRGELYAAARHQDMILKAPASLVYTAIFKRMTSKYGERGRIRYVPMDVGHSAQNVYLQVTAMNLGTCAVGAFDDEQVSIVLDLPPEEEPLYIIPVGYYYG